MDSIGLGRWIGAFQGIEKMERETGVEPATSSLGNYGPFENKRHRRYSAEF